jgi:microcystin degradation protein MlrC
MRLFTATLATETNTFSPMPTSLDGYRQSVFFRPGEHPADAPRMCTAPLFVARARAGRDGFELVEGSCFAASPAGTTNRADYEWMRDEILKELKAAMPVDGLLLGLHGAMVAHGYDDVEGDIIERCREIVGSKCVIGVELDPHCHLTLKRLSRADIIVLYKEFPHTDVVDRADDVIDLVLATLRGRIKPVMSVYDCRQIQSYPTSREPMRSFVDRIKAMEGKDGILSVSVAHCFPYGDVAELGTRVLVMADGDKKKADALATKLGEELVALRGKTYPATLNVAAGVGEGVAFNDLPVVIADPADNAGGGAPSDNTDILRHLIDTKVENACLGPIWDPVAVRLCFDAGLGTKFSLRFGGKIAVTSGQPVDAEVEVIGLKRDAWQRFGPTQVPIGDCAAVRVADVDVALISNRTQATGLELFTNLGIDPRQKKLVVVKSTNHFMAAYGPIAKKVIYVESNAPLSRDYTKIPYQKAERPIWPLDKDARPRGLIF